MKITKEVFYDMRLYNVYYLCKSCQDSVNVLKFAKTNTNPSSVYILDGWVEFKKVLITLRKASIFKNLSDEFYNAIPVFVRDTAKPQIDAMLKSKLEKQLFLIKNRIDTIIDLYESMDLGENDNAIDVKIPHCDSLGQYISYLKDINFVFEQCPFLQHKDGKIKFDTVDVGSQWLTFVIEAAAGTAAVTYILNNLATLLDKAVQIKSHMLNLEQQKEIIQNEKERNNLLESDLKMFDFLKNHYIATAIDEIESSSDDNKFNDGEERGKAEKSLEKVCDLLNKGVEIYASIDTDKEIQVLFPTMTESLSIPDDILKYIEQKKDE